MVSGLHEIIGCFILPDYTSAQMARRVDHENMQSLPL